MAANLKLDSIIVIDVESTCWENNYVIPRNEFSEIIEIGIAEVDLVSMQTVRTESIIVKPKNSTVSPFCTQLTTLTQDMVDKGISLKEACDILKTKYHTKNRIFASYGDYDRKMFEKGCKGCTSANIDYPFGHRHINIKTWFALAMGLNRELGMDVALSMLNIELEGTHHRGGGDDAKNIAKIFNAIHGATSKLREAYTNNAALV